MAISNRQLDEVVQAWNSYAEGRPGNIKASDLLIKRDLSMYKGLGVRSISELASQLVNDRAVATMEMTMGHLYERVLEQLGPRKVSSQEKRRPGLRGIDFIEDTPSQHRLVNLKSSLSTPNGDINAQTITTLLTGKQHWESQHRPDDNPLGRARQMCVIIRAVARGPSKQETTADGILWLVGGAMWSYFGGGDDLLKRLGKALGRRPLDFQAYTSELEKAKLRVGNTLRQFSLQGQRVDWDQLIVRYP